MIDTDREVVAMTRAEFRIARERLGLTRVWLHQELGVQERAVYRWESGERPISTERAEQIRQMVAFTDDFIDQVAAELTLAAEDERTVLTYYDDDEYKREHPGTAWPASWHRAAMGRVAERVAGVRIRYFTPEPDLDDDEDAAPELDDASDDDE